VVALVAVGLVALLLVGAVVALVALGDDDEPDRADDTTTSAAADPTTGSTELPGSTEGPTSSEGPTTSDGPIPTPSLPGGGGVSAPPEAFPDPPGATDSITGGIAVEGMTAQQVADFYEAELPGAGYTVDRVDDVGGVVAITVSGPDSGILSITSLSPLPTTVLWTAS